MKSKTMFNIKLEYIRLSSGWWMMDGRYAEEQWDGLCSESYDLSNRNIINVLSTSKVAHSKYLEKY